MDREQALDVALGQIERQFGKGAVMKMNDRAAVSIGAISTGSLALDLALGIGGLPRGRIVEVFGPESSGKTTLVYHVIAEAQRRGGICAFIDAEHAMDPAYAKRIGVNIDNLLVSQPDTGEQALEPAEEVLGQPSRRAGDVLQNEHADASRLAVSRRQQPDRARGGGRPAQRLGDRRDLASRPVAQEREREMQVLARDDPAVAQLAGLPGRQRVERRFSEPQRAEEP